jgi:hypothetical protein
MNYAQAFDLEVWRGYSNFLMCEYVDLRICGFFDVQIVGWEDVQIKGFVKG